MVWFILTIIEDRPVVIELPWLGLSSYALLSCSWVTWAVVYLFISTSCLAGMPAAFPDRLETCRLTKSSYVFESAPRILNSIQLNPAKFHWLLFIQSLRKLVSITHHSV